jgi:ankyrin repeat protein
MLCLGAGEPLTVNVVKAIHTGHIPTLKRLLAKNPDLATARLGASRTLLHVVTDWPGHFPNGAATVAALIEAGAEVNARFAGQHTETPLHWAASSDDVEVLDALLDADADIDAPGAVIGGGTPLDDAVAFGQWQAAHRLVQRGVRTTFWHAGALGLMDRVEEHFAGNTSPPLEEVAHAFWLSCHGGQRQCAEYLLDRGADLNWIPGWEDMTPLDAARRSGAEELVEWLREQGARSAKEQE